MTEANAINGQLARERKARERGKQKRLEEETNVQQGCQRRYSDQTSLARRHLHPRATLWAFGLAPSLASYLATNAGRDGAQRGLVGDSSAPRQISSPTEWKHPAVRPSLRGNKYIGWTPIPHTRAQPAVAASDLSRLPCCLASDPSRPCAELESIVQLCKVRRIGVRSQASLANVEKVGVPRCASGGVRTEYVILSKEPRCPDLVSQARAGGVCMHEPGWDSETSLQAELCDSILPATDPQRQETVGM